MTSRRLLLLLMGVLTLSTARAQNLTIILDTLTTIRAGDPWGVTVRVSGGGAGQTVDAVLVNGLQTFHTTLTLGNGGVAAWWLPADAITQAGTSALIVTTSTGDSVRQTLDVLPLEPVTADFFSSANTLTAYGTGTATVMLLPRDTWGNPAADMTPFYAITRWPDSSFTINLLAYTAGLGTLELTSRAGPGRVRLSLVRGDLDLRLELTQTPGAPADVSLMRSPACLPADGRDVVTLNAIVRDAAGQPVADGTLVTFTWAGGLGYGRTLDGRATLRLPGPTDPGAYPYRVTAGGVESAPITVQVATVCHDEP